MILETWDEAKLKLLYPQGKTFVNTKDNHYKFWHIVRKGTEVTTSWGRMGKKIQTLDKSFGYEYAADTFMDQKIREKTRKGYEEI